MGRSGSVVRVSASNLPNVRHQRKHILCFVWFEAFFLLSPGDAGRLIGDTWRGICFWSRVFPCLLVATFVTMATVPETVTTIIVKLSGQIGNCTGIMLLNLPGAAPCNGQPLVTIRWYQHYLKSYKLLMAI